MTAPALAAPAPDATRAPAPMPCLVGRDRYWSTRRTVVSDARSRPVASVSTLPTLLEHRVVRLAERAAPELRAIDDDEWFAMLRRAATAVRAAIVDSDGGSERRRYPEMVSAATGLPIRRVERGAAAVAGDLENMAEILAAQSPDGEVAAFRTGRVRGRPWRWLPAGNHVGVRVPDNFPTINVEWMQALGARRPVVLGTSPADPFTPLLLAGALYDAGLPDGAVSVAHGAASGLWARLDHVLWPGEPPADMRLRACRVKTYHHARSKAVVMRRTGRHWCTALARLAVQGCGRLCTNPSAVVVVGDARDGMEVAECLAAALSRYTVLPLDDPGAVVPAHAPDAARRIDAALSEAVARGAVDVTARVSGVPRLAETHGLPFVRPTVLAMAADDPMFGVNLPFPYVAVGAVRAPEVAAVVRESLVVWLLGAPDDMVDATIAEPTVGKVLTEAWLERAYDPRDPHEGFIADFLFQKKAVFAGAPEGAS